MQGDIARRNALTRLARAARGWVGAVALAAMLLVPRVAVVSATEPESVTILDSMVPHRALYDMAMVRVRPGSGVVGVSGRMYLEWASACDGWRVEQRIVMRMAHGDGNESSTDSYFKSWESRDGTQFRFDLRTQRDGTLDEDLGGTARLRSDSEGGVAVYRRPEAKEVELPPGTVFPTAHTGLVAAAIRRGERMVGRVVFDGGGEDNPLYVNAIIGQREEPAESATEATNGPGERASWPVAMAFYRLDDAEGLPLYEIMIQLQGNGVARRLDLDYGDFAVRARLVGFERLAPPKC